MRYDLCVSADMMYQRTRNKVFKTVSTCYSQSVLILRCNFRAVKWSTHAVMLSHEVHDINTHLRSTDDSLCFLH